MTLSRSFPALITLSLLMFPLKGISQTISQDTIDQWKLEAFNSISAQEADRNFSRLLAGLRQNDDSSGWRKIQMGRADLYAEAEWIPASEILRSAISESWWTPDKNTAYLYTYLGYYANQEGDRLLSKESRESAYELMKSGEVPWNNYLISNVLRPLGNAYTSFGEHQKARLVLEDAYRFLSENEVEDDAEELALITSDLAILYQVTGEPELAGEKYETTLSTPFLSVETRALLLINYAGALLEINQVEASEKRSVEAINLLDSHLNEEGNDRYLSAAYSTLAAALEARGEFHGALKQVDVAIRVGKRTYLSQFSREMAAMYLQRAEVYQGIGLPEKGLADCQLALERLLPGYRIGDGLSFGNPNRYLPENRLWEAFTLQASLLEDIYSNTSRSEYLAAALKAHEAAMKVEALQLQVFAYDESSLSLLAANRAQKSDAVSLAWKAYKETPDSETFFEALSIAERSRSLLLQDRKNQLELMADQQSDPILVREIDKIDSLIADAQIILRELDLESIAYLDQEAYLDSLVSVSYQLRDQLISISPLYASARFGDLPFDLAEFRSLLPSEVLVVSYFLGESDLFVFGLSSTSQSFIRIPISADLNSEVNLLSEAITLPYIGRPSMLAELDSVRKKLSWKLYQELLAPILSSPEFSKASRTWIIPDGIIGRIPFAMLHTEPTDAEYYVYEPFLVRKTSLAMANNLTLLYLQLEAEEKGETSELLCVAPSYEAGGFGSVRSVGTDIPVAIPEGVRLVFHLQEAEYLNDRYGGGFLYEKEATIAAFLESAGDYSMLHFSGHAQPDSATGTWNFLALEPEAGNLDAFAAFWQPQILSLRLRAELVYLSACETSRGKFYQGEGHSSLARAFLYAGSESVVATLWQIDDSVSLRFSQRFYENLEAGQPKDLAMQQTMISMIEENRPPYAWGPYLLWGDSDPVLLDQRNTFPTWLVLGFVIGFSVAMGMVIRQRMISKGRVVDTPS